MLGGARRYLDGHPGVRRTPLVLAVLAFLFVCGMYIYDEVGYRTVGCLRDKTALEFFKMGAAMLGLLSLVGCVGVQVLLKRRSRGSAVSLVVNLAMLCAVGVALVFLAPGGMPYRPSGKAYDGPSTGLKQTVLVPTLDTPVTPGKNIIWCGSFQIAWKALADGLAKEPVRLDGAEDIVERLNRSPLSEEDLPPGSYYAAAGFTSDGIFERIRKEMKERFPAARCDLRREPGNAAVAYGYLAGAVKFAVPYFESPEPLTFTDSAGRKTGVGSFGIRKEHEYAYGELRAQVDVLHLPRDDYGMRPGTFAIDPCSTSKPVQIILASVELGESLASTLADLNEKIASYSGAYPFGPNDTLLVPNVCWEIRHSFQELRKRNFLNPALDGLWISDAWQRIAFRLDRSGAELESEAAAPCGPIARHYVFDRPFLVVLKVRGRENPFFVMWVDNAELLCGPN